MRTEWRVGRWLGEADGPCVTILDSPGLEDTEGRDRQHTADIGETVRRLGEIDLFLLLIKSDMTRLRPGTKNQLKTFTKLFGGEFWRKVSVVITFWAHDSRSRRARGEKTEETHSQNLRDILREKLNITHHLDVLYIDSKMNFRDADQYEREIFQTESEKILEKSREGDPFRCTEFSCLDTGDEEEGFQSFWRLIELEVENELKGSEKSLNVSLPLCDGSASCSLCACDFRNDLIEKTLRKIESTVSLAVQQAEDVFGEDISQRINEIYEIKITPWRKNNSCSTILQQNKRSSSQSEFCDFSEMREEFIKPSSDVAIVCKYAFLCGSLTFAGSNITISAENIYFSRDTNIDVKAPAKADDGLEGQTPGSAGRQGSEGRAGTSLYLTSRSLMLGSKTSFVFTSRGGDGGDGGRGAVGEMGRDGEIGEDGRDGTEGEAGARGEDRNSVGTENDPKTADEVYARPNKGRVVNDKMIGH